MNKKLRLLVTTQCHNNCPICPNKQLEATLPSNSRLFNNIVTYPEDNITYIELHNTTIN